MPNNRSWPKDPDSRGLDAIFRPRSIAVVGASRDRTSIGREILHNLIEYEFNGTIFPVNPKATTVHSLKCYPDVGSIPDPVDLAVIVVPRDGVVDVADQCGRTGVKGIVVITAGFKEAGGEGARLEAALLEKVRGYRMRMVGPNCMGVVNTDPRVSMNAQFVGVTPRSGSIGFLSQSGALGIAIIAHANRLGLGMSSFVSVGNKADISGNDLIQYWEHDERTRVILLYLESFGNPRKFARITRRVARKKPIVAVKSGRSAAGFRATQSHTGALVSTSDVTVDTLFRQSGVIRVDTLGEMFDVAALLATQPVPGGDRVAVLTNGGGLGILAADACEGFGLRVPELSPQTQAALRDFLPPAAGARNPVDMMGSATPEDYGRAIEIVGHDPAVDAVIAAFVPPIAVRHEDVAAEIVRATRNLEGRVVVLSIFAGIHGDPAHLSDGDTRVPSYPFPEPAARALARAVQHGRWLATPEEPARPTPGTRCEEAVALVARALARGGGWLPPDETAALLDCHGIATVRTLRAESPEDAGRIAAEMGTKVVLKGIVPGLVHKSEAGAVRLNLVGARQVERVARDMRARLARAGVAVTGWVVQPMVPTGMEMLVGVTHDPIFGPVVACGAGGVLVELLRDVSIRLAPLTGRDVREMVRELKTFPVFTGYRGGARYDLAALEEIILRVGALAEEIPEILELDLNPVIVLPEGQGAAIVDARVRVGITPPPLPVGAKRRG
ncbi:MAG: acetate--CoA ligase family protein [Armatimonadetes bacterium]|nr:acetate--CoA ligase family protein [Armatimonadota bacterium]